jgi:tetratricopeptide (TPR) repeat protein
LYNKNLRSIKANDTVKLNTLGALLFRGGRHQEAIKRLQEAVKQSWGQKGSAWHWLFLAMAQQKLGHAEEARRSLAKAEEGLKDPHLSWNQKLELNILHREATALVKGTRR